MRRLRFRVPPRPATFPIPAAWLAILLLAPPGRAADLLPAALAYKLDPRLVAAYSQAPTESSSIWVEFADKGALDPRERIERLATADAALTPRARARRLRAGVRPLVDELDVPLHAPYLSELAAHGITPYATSRWFNRVAVRVPARAFADLAALPCVKAIAPVERGRVIRVPAPAPNPAEIGARPARLQAVDYGLTRSQLEQLAVPALHDSGYTGAGVMVAVLDAGFNYFDKHEALRDHVIPAERQRDFLRGIHEVQDTLDVGFTHGTWVLGCLAGRKFGQYVGAAYDAEYALARTEVVDTETPQEMAFWGMGAEWADSLGADIISSSVGYSLFDDPQQNFGYADMNGHTTLVTRAAQIAASKGILVVTAVGNEGASAWHYLIAPGDANGDSVLTIGAVDAVGAPAAFSSYGPSADGRIKPDLAARGVANPVVATTGGPQDYSFLSGSSFATPLVAGMAACLMQARPQWTPVELIAALRSTASRSSTPDDRVGYGLPSGSAVLCRGSAVVTPPVAQPRLRLRGPNPVNLGRGPARFTFEVPFVGSGYAGPGTVRVFDALGRRVRELWSGVLPCPLPMALSWDGLDQKGRACGPGLYLVELSAGGRRTGLRITCLR